MFLAAPWRRFEVLEALGAGAGSKEALKDEARVGFPGESGWVGERQRAGRYS